MGSPRSASAVATVAVPLTRESRISFLYAGVQRCSPTPAPARWTTAVRPERSPGLSLWDAGSQPISYRARGSRRTRCTTSSPRALRNADSTLPIRPEAPVMPTHCRGGSGSDWGSDIRALESQGCFEGAFLEAGLHRRQEACGVRTVNHTVVV